MNTVVTENDRGVGSSRPLAVFFWLAGLVLMPLSLSPAVLYASGTTGLEATPLFRASLQLGLLLLAVIAISGTKKDDSRRLGARKALVLKSPWKLAALMLVAWILLSGLAPGNAPWGRLLGSPERTDGNLVQATWFLLPITAAAMTWVTGLSRRWVFSNVLTGALLTSAWATLQALNLDPLTYVSRYGLYLDIPAGAFGHGALASLYLVFVLLILWSVTASRGRANRADYLLSAALGLGAASAGGRSAAVGLVVSTILLWFVLKGRPNMRRTLLTLILSALLGAVVAYSVLPRTQRQAASTGAAMIGSDGSFNARLPAWRGGSRLLLANPLFGVGPEGFGYSVWPLLSPGDRETLIRSALWNEVAHLALDPGDYSISGNVIAFTGKDGRLTTASLGWDKAHDYYLDLGLMSGIPALALFLLMIAMMLRTLFSSRDPYVLGVGLGLVAFLVFGIAWFGTVSLDPVIWLLVGWGLGLAEKEDGGLALPGKVTPGGGTGDLNVG